LPYNLNLLSNLKGNFTVPKFKISHEQTTDRGIFSIKQSIREETDFQAGASQSSQSSEKLNPSQEICLVYKQFQENLIKHSTS
jgi:hypothetical protein